MPGCEKEILETLNCGDTGMNGAIEFCSDCISKLEKEYPQGWKYVPGDICSHGVYIHPCYDCSCWRCEEE